MGCVSTRLAGGSSTSIEQATLSVGDRQYQFDACRSGDREYFLGVDLASRRSAVSVRLVIDAMEEPRLRVILGEGGAKEGLALGRDQCRQLEAQVRHTGWRINTVRDLSGFIDAECRDDEGQAISLHVRFSHCH